jgi:hypothetical protein
MGITMNSKRNLDIYVPDSGDEGEPLIGIQEENDPIETRPITGSGPNLLTVPNEILNIVSSFLPTPSENVDGVDNVLKAVNTQLSGKKDRYATRWAANAYNKSFLCPVIPLENNVSDSDSDSDSDDDESAFCMQQINPNRLMKSYRSNCFEGFLCAVFPVTAICGIPQYGNHLVSSLLCGIGFFAGKVKDECFVNHQEKIDSPEEARKMSPRQQEMK